MKVVATGGLAPLFAEGTMQIQPIDLTLDGLLMLAERDPAPVMPREQTPGHDGEGPALTGQNLISLV